MAHRLTDGTVRETQRRVIHVLRIQGATLEPMVVHDLAERMRERLASRGEVTADVVVIQGDTKETLALFGEPYPVSRVRAALFNAAVRFAPFDLD